jgi:molybdopterin converting factor small subunit
MIRMLAFAGARDVIGHPEVDLAAPAPCTVDELLAHVCEAYPGLGPHKKSLRLAVNGTYANGSDHVLPGDEVALIPPVAGG